MDRRAPTAELLPSFATRQETTKDEVCKPSRNISVSEDSDTEIIDEIQPRRRGPKRKKKAEIIPEISEKKVVRESKRRLEPETTDDEITLEMWTDDEDQSRYRKNPSLTIPKLHEHIRAWNTYGEQYSGEVIQHWSQRPNQFKIKEHETSAEMWVDLNKINQWRYMKKPETEFKVGTLELPSGPILHSGAIDNEEYIQFYYNCITRGESYHYEENG
jgi:hypothetical protein